MKTLITMVLLSAASVAGAQTITYTGASCTRSSSAITASCVLAGVSVGDLEVITSKSSSNTASATAVLTFSGAPSCSTSTPVIAPSPATWQSNGAGHFITAMFACIVSTAGTSSPVVTWSGTDATFTDIKAATYHAATSWASNFVDKVATNKAITSTTDCPTGATAATSNANDLIVATCDNFDTAETWGTLTGFTHRPNSSRNTNGWYDTTVSSTGTQAATIPLSASDVGVGMIAAFAAK